MKTIKRAPRWAYLVLSILTTTECLYGFRQTWLKYRWGEVLLIPLSDTIRTGIVSALFGILAIGCWYLWLTYHKKSDRYNT